MKKKNENKTLRDNTVTAMTAGQALCRGMAAKLAAGALALCMIGGVFTGCQPMQNRDHEPSNAQSAVTETGSARANQGSSLANPEPSQTEQPTEQPTEQTYFVRVEDGDRTYFTDGQTEIWQENTAIQKKDLASGTVETLFSVTNESEAYKKTLEGVTANRLYFSDRNQYNNDVDSVYSTSYENRDQINLAEHCSVSFQDGWTLIEGGQLQGDLQVVDRNDQAVKLVNHSFGWAVSDGSLYYIYSPALEDDDYYSSLKGTEGAHVRYEVCKLDRAGGNTTRIGSFDQPFIFGSFRIDAEADEISSDELVEILDLNTLQVKGYSDAAVPDLVPVDPETLVSEAMLIQGTYTDDPGNVYDYSYSIPRLNADTPDAAAINQEIDSKYGELARYVQSLEDGNESLIDPTVKYSVTIWQDVVTTVVTTHCNWGFDGYDVYCYDCSTGRRLNTSALLRKMGITPDEFLEACADRFYERFDSLHENYTDGLEGEELEKTIAARAEYREYVAKTFYVNVSVPAYPNEDGSITVVGSIVSMAGADSYDYLIDLGRLGEN